MLQLAYRWANFRHTIRSYINIVWLFRFETFSKIFTRYILNVIFYVFAYVHVWHLQYVHVWHLQYVHMYMCMHVTLCDTVCMCDTVYMCACVTLCVCVNVWHSVDNIVCFVIQCPWWVWMSYKSSFRNSQEKFYGTAWVCCCQEILKWHLDILILMVNVYRIA